jgi:hypothetical protein
MGLTLTPPKKKPGSTSVTSDPGLTVDDFTGYERSDENGAPTLVTAQQQFDDYLANSKNSLDANSLHHNAGVRAKEIADLMQQDVLFDPDAITQYRNWAKEAQAGIDESWHDAGGATANSFARRGLGGSGMAMREQYELANKRKGAVDDAILRAQAAAIQSQRSNLAAEQTILTGIQSNDINAQRLQMEKQAQQDQILADAISALSEGAVGYMTEADRKKKEQQAAQEKSLGAIPAGGGV